MQINEPLLTPAPDAMLDGHDYYDTGNRHRLSLIVEHIVEHMAGCVCKHISKRLSCETCKDALLAAKSRSLLLMRQLSGQLFMASQDAFNVCKIGERCFRFAYESDLNI